MFSRALVISAFPFLPLILCAGIYVQAQERGYLDATQVRIRQRQREAATGSSGFSSSVTEGQILPTQPLSLSLKISGRAEFARGEAFEYQVQIQNVSDRPVDLPWDLSPADIEPSDPHARYEYQTAAIWLVAKLQDNRTVTMEGPILLFGSSSAKSTIIELQPGEWVRVKATGRALSSNPNDAWPPSDLTSKQVEGNLAATLLVYAHSFSPATEGNSHEDSRMTTGPIFSNALAVRFRF